jgi:hypothetical protein
MPDDIRARSRQTLARIQPTKSPQTLQRDTNEKSIRALQASQTSQEIPASIPRSATDVHKVNTVSPLLALPPEIVLKILGNLQELKDLFSTILACRRIFNIFREAQKPLIESAFAKYTRLKANRGTYKVLTELGLIIRRDMVHRHVVQHIFETGWELFRKRDQEELLIPFGRGLAWSYVLDNRRPDAINLLRRIQKGEPPFKRSTRMQSQPPIQPIRELLEQLVSEESGSDRKHISSDLDHPLVEIKSKSIQIASHLVLSETERSTLLRDGILFTDQSIVVIKSKPNSLKTYPQHTFHHSLFRSRSIYNETTGGNIMEALAHRPPSCRKHGH